MTEKKTYCSVPRLFGKRFAAWFEKHFHDACHKHDRNNGIYTKVWRIKSDIILFWDMLTYSWKPQYWLAAVSAFVIVRFGNFRRYHLKKSDGTTVPWYYAI